MIPLSKKLWRPSPVSKVTNAVILELFKSRILLTLTPLFSSQLMKKTFGATSDE
jgi:hypothetical protein